MKQLRKTVSLLLVLALVLTVLPFGILADELPELGTPVDGDISFLFPVSKYALGDFPVPAGCSDLGQETVYFSDSFFLHSAFEYDHALATASLAACMSGATYAGDSVVRDFLTNIGCDEGTIFTHRFDDTRSSDDISAFAFGLKKLPGSDKYLLTVIMRGNNYGAEWVSNVRVYGSDCKDYSLGFRKGAEYAKGYLDTYIAGLAENYGITTADLKLWINGYSRGAAMGNNLGQMMSAEENGIAAEDIYVYTFATPNTVLKRSAGNYPNIFSICSELDVVPRLPLVEWGYTHFGTTLYLPCLSKNGSSYYELLSGMQEQFSAIMVGIGLPDDVNVPLDYQEKAIDLCASILSGPIASPSQYEKEGWQKILVDVLVADRVGNPEGKDIGTLLLEAFLPAGDLLPYVKDFFENSCTRTPYENINAINKILTKIDLQKLRVTSERDRELLTALYGLFLDYRTCLRYEALTHGNSNSTVYYHTLIAEIFGVIESTASSPLLMQHWPEAYLAWMRSGSPEQIFTTESHKITDIKTPLLAGDVNGDGDVTSADSMLLNAYLLAPWKVKLDKEAADVDGNGRITVADLTTLNILLTMDVASRRYDSYLNKIM